MTEEMIKQIKRLLFDYTEVYDDEPIFQELELLIKDNYISKDKIKEVIKKYYNDYEEQKRYRYTRDVEEEQSVLKDIEKELLEEE